MNQQQMRCIAIYKAFSCFRISNMVQHLIPKMINQCKIDYDKNGIPDDIALKYGISQELMKICMDKAPNMKIEHLMNTTNPDHNFLSILDDDIIDKAMEYKTTKNKPISLTKDNKRGKKRKLDRNKEEVPTEPAIKKRKKKHKKQEIPPMIELSSGSEIEVKNKKKKNKKGKKIKFSESESDSDIEGTKKNKNKKSKKRKKREFSENESDSDIEITKNKKKKRRKNSKNNNDSDISSETTNSKKSSNKSPKKSSKKTNIQNIKPDTIFKGTTIILHNVMSLKVLKSAPTRLKALYECPMVNVLPEDKLEEKCTKPLKYNNVKMHIYTHQAQRLDDFGFGQVLNDGCVCSQHKDRVFTTKQVLNNHFTPIGTCDGIPKLVLNQTQFPKWLRTWMNNRQ